MEVLRPREDKGPLRVPRCPRATEDLGETGRMSYRGQLLQVSKDSDVRKLVCGVDLDELEVSKLDDLMREVLADVNHHAMMCLARSRPPTTLFLHSMQVVLSSKTGVQEDCTKPIP
jgi:hypothetical protein